MYEAIIKTVSIMPGVCVSCSFIASSIAEGCTLELRNDKKLFVFNISRHYHEYLELECFPVLDPGDYSVYAYERQHGKVQNHTCIELHGITIQERECKKN